MQKYAINDETGEVLKQTEAGWQKVQSARNDQGVILINEGQGWVEPPSPAAQEPSNAVRPAPKQTATLNPSQEAQLAMFGKLDRAVEGNPGRMAAFAAQTGNAATAGGFDYLMGGLDQLAPGAGAIDKGSVGDSVARMRQTRQGLREQHPFSAGAGDITGAIALGLPAFRASAGVGDDIVRAIPGKNALAQTSRFITRGAGSALEGLKQLALYEAGAGGSNRAAEQGREVGLGERMEMAGDAVTDPVMGGLAAAAGPLGIAGSRVIRYGTKGRFTPSDVPGGVGQAPSLADIEQMKQQAYQIADDLGVSYTPDSFADLVARIENKLTQEGIDPVLHQKATRNLRRIQDRVGDQPITLQELDRIRQFTRRDVIDSSMGANASPGEARLGSMVMDEIDDFIEGGAGAIGGGEQAGQAITQARNLNAVWRRAQLLADAVESAQLRSASTGSGGNFENALRQEIRKLYQNPKKIRGFDEAERAAMRQVIEGGPVQNILRQIGKLSPQGNGLMASIGIGSTAAQPLLAPVWLGGMAAKHMAEKGIKGKFDQLDDLVRGKASQNALAGASPPQAPASTSVNALSGAGGPPASSPPQVTQGANALAGQSPQPVAPAGGDDIKQMGAVNSTLGGAVAGGAAGGMTGETPEERMRNALIGAAGGAALGRGGKAYMRGLADSERRTVARQAPRPATRQRGVATEDDYRRTYASVEQQLKREAGVSSAAGSRGAYVDASPEAVHQETLRRLSDDGFDLSTVRKPQDASISGDIDMNQYERIYREVLEETGDTLNETQIQREVMRRLANEESRNAVMRAPSATLN